MASKGFFAVAEAVRALAVDGTPVRLVTLGRPVGDETMNQHACCEALKRLEGQTWMDRRGPVDRPTAMQLLHEADVVCLPSHYISECQPLSLVEAMCAGRKLVIAGTPALLATIGDYPCKKVSGPVASEIALALRDVMEQPGSDDEALQSAATHARERFSPERFDRDMARLLQI